MNMVLLSAFILLRAGTALASTSQSPVLEHQSGPNEHSARAAAPQIFNALHSSMRQWGSSLNHNGMSFFPATIPKHTSFYHGSQSTEPVTGTEWLAFEVEHAENFARGHGPPGKGRRPPGGPPPQGEDYTKSELRRKRKEPAKAVTGALHHYRSSHDMRVLFLDGMSAGKTSMGTLDQQTYILCNESAEDFGSTHAPESQADPGERRGPMGDFNFATQMCEDFSPFIEGIVRMEAGFELIMCNFTASTDLISVTPRPSYDIPEYSSQELRSFEYVRGISYRYQGVTAGRVRVDYSSMVSAFFYNINLTNPSPAHAPLPRLSSADPATLKEIKTDVLSIFSNPSEAPSVDWQGVVDLIVTRYSDRLQFLALASTTHKTLLGELNFLLNMYIDYSVSKPSVPLAISRCTAHYLSGLPLSTQSDHLLYAAVSTVTSRLCTTLFSVRTSVLESNSTSTLEAAKSDINKLTDYLSWTTWLECGKCAYDEVCFVAIWPFGGVKEHEQPSCVSKDDVDAKRGYWEGGPGGPGGPGRGREPLDNDHGNRGDGGWAF